MSLKNNGLFELEEGSSEESANRIFRGYAEEILPRLPREQKYDVIYFDTLRPPADAKFERQNHAKNMEIAMCAALRLSKTNNSFFIVQGVQIDSLVAQISEIFEFRFLFEFACVYPVRPLLKSYDSIPMIHDRVVVLGRGQLNKPNVFKASDWELKRLYPVEVNGKRAYKEKDFLKFYDGGVLPSVTSVLNSDNEKMQSVFSNKTKAETFYARLFGAVKKADHKRFLIIHFGAGSPILACEKMGIVWDGISSNSEAILSVKERLKNFANEPSLFGKEQMKKQARAFGIWKLKNEPNTSETEILPF